MKTAKSEKAHATYSASGAERWLSCPGSIKLSERAPPQPESPYALEGTRAHKCLEAILKRNDYGFDYPKEMHEHAVKASEWIEDYRDRLPGSVLFTEQKVDSSPFTCDGQFGTLDAAIVQEFGKLVVIDYKYGAGVAVDPEGADGRGNPQLVYYALALSHQYGHNFAEVELVVIQPRAYHESGNTTRTFSMSMDELLRWEDIFLDGVFETNLRDPALIPGKWCRWCPAAVICPELKDKSLKEAKIVFDDDNGLQSMPAPDKIKIPGLAKMLDACDRLEEWIGKVREHAFHQLESGHDVKGWKLVQKRPTRKWRDGELARRSAAAEFGPKAFTDPELLSPAQLEQTPLATRKGFIEWFGKHVISESSGLTMARDDDKRDAVRSVDEVFKDEPKKLPAPVKASVMVGKLPTVKTKKRK